MRPVLLAFVAFLALTAAARADEVTIGVAGPMSGPMEIFGEQMIKGAEIAVADLNARGGLLDHKINLEVDNDGCDVKRAQGIAEKFGEEKAVAVFGHWCSAPSVAASSIYAKEGLLQIEVGARFGDVTERGLKNIFRVSATDKAFARAIVLYTGKHNPNASVVIISDKSSPVTTELTDYLQKDFSDSLNSIIGVETIASGQKDFSKILDRIGYDNPGVVICACYEPEAALFVQQMQEKKIDAWFTTWDAIDMPGFLTTVGKENTGKVVFIGYAHPTEQNYLYRHLTQSLWQRQWVMETQIALTYAAVEAWAEAVTKIRSFDMKKVADVMRRDIFPTALGNFRFGGDGDRMDTDFAAYQWVDGDLKIKDAAVR